MLSLYSTSGDVHSQVLALRLKLSFQREVAQVTPGEYHSTTHGENTTHRDCLHFPLILFNTGVKSERMSHPAAIVLLANQSVCWMSGLCGLHGMMGFFQAM